MQVLSNMIFGSLVSLALAASSMPASTTYININIASSTPIINCVSEECIKEKVHLKALEYTVSENEMWKIIHCEDPSLDPQKQSDYIYDHDVPEYGLKAGERERSFGLVQIHLPAHKEISYSQATDVDFSINFLALNLKAGKGSIWTCF